MVAEEEIPAILVLLGRIVSGLQVPQMMMRIDDRRRESSAAGRALRRSSFPPNIIRCFDGSGSGRLMSTDVPLASEALSYFEGCAPPVGRGARDGSLPLDELGPLAGLDWLDALAII